MSDASQPKPEVRILVGYDGSDDGAAALAFAIREAKTRDAILHLVYAVDDTVINSAWGIVFDVEAVRRAGLELLETARQQALTAGVPAEKIEVDCLVGNPAAVMARLSEDSSLAVVGRHSESGVRAMFVGSTAVGLVATASCPVVVATSEAPQTEPKGVIGMGIDPGAEGVLALEWAVRRARRTGSSVRVLTTVRDVAPRFFGAQPVPVADIEASVADVTKRVQASVDAVTAKVPGVDVNVEVRTGSPLDELVAFSSEVDMLIIGVHPVFPTYSVGGIARGLMAHGGCPLGILRRD